MYLQLSYFKNILLPESQLCLPYNVCISKFLVKSPESLGSHLKQLLAEAERHVQELGGCISSLDESAAGCNNNNNNNINRASFSSFIHHTAAASPMTGCSGGGADAATDKQLMLWERRAKGLKKMLLGFDQASTFPAGSSCLPKIPE